MGAGPQEKSTARAWRADVGRLDRGQPGLLRLGTQQHEHRRQHERCRERCGPGGGERHSCLPPLGDLRLAAALEVVGSVAVCVRRVSPHHLLLVVLRVSSRGDARRGLRQRRAPDTCCHGAWKLPWRQRVRRDKMVSGGGLAGVVALRLEPRGADGPLLHHVRSWATHLDRTRLEQQLRRHSSNCLRHRGLCAEWLRSADPGPRPAFVVRRGRVPHRLGPALSGSRRFSGRRVLVGVGRHLAALRRAAVAVCCAGCPPGARLVPGRTRQPHSGACARGSIGRAREVQAD
mmetsp:Transcript_129048/g.413473  ORF Transcript_129048/g.413473 Transcript_129048/m.413473 type:complete len:289 (-) Transcript_129048:664-1530(-)